MSSAPEAKKILFFIKSPAHNLKALETFLNKRNFIIHVESEIKEALTKIIEIQPQFIFIAWDHENPRVHTIPRLLEQACGGMVVPYIMSNSREATRKLNMCPLNPKLYPPVSGPAIERLVLKSHKAGDEAAARGTSGPVAKSKEELITIKSRLMAGLEAGADAESGNPDAPEQAEEIRIREREQEQRHRRERQLSIDGRNDLLRRAQKEQLRTEAIDELKKSFQGKVQTPLENLLSTLSESAPATDGTPGAQDTPAGGSEVIIQKGLSNPQGLGLAIEAGTAGELHSSGPAAASGETPAGYMPAPPPRAYGLAVCSEHWCGYLIITTEFALDFSSIDMIFGDWIGSHLPSLHELDEKDFFEFYHISPEVLEALTGKAEYSESVRINGCNMKISFFSVNPDKMLVELNDDKSHIKIATIDIPAGEEVGFSLHLHLPENKKYLLYTPANRALHSEQKNRLLANKVHMLYTLLDYEKEYKKFIAEKNVREICFDLSKKFSGL